jgi:hypothetical protein
MAGSKTSYERGVPKERPSTVVDRGGPTEEGPRGSTPEPTRTGVRPRQEECPEQVTVVLPAGETLPTGSPVSLIRDAHSPSRVALLHGNRLIPLPPESVTEGVRDCVSREVRYVGAIERYGRDPTRLAALLRKE